VEERAKLDQAIASGFERATFSSIAYAYDQHGRVLQRTDKMGILSEDRTTYRHDDHGKSDRGIHRKRSPVGEHSRQRRGGNRGGHARPAEVRFEYQYDDRGNWTERVVRIRDGADAGPRPSTATWRAITYYDA
jgi:hypothetical protein